MYELELCMNPKQYVYPYTYTCTVYIHTNIYIYLHIILDSFKFKIPLSSMLVKIIHPRQIAKDSDWLQDLMGLLGRRPSRMNFGVSESTPAKWYMFQDVREAWVYSTWVCSVLMKLDIANQQMLTNNRNATIVLHHLWSPLPCATVLHPPHQHSLHSHLHFRTLDEVAHWQVIRSHGCSTIWRKPRRNMPTQQICISFHHFIGGSHSLICELLERSEPEKKRNSQRLLGTEVDAGRNWWKLMKFSKS